MSFYSLSSDYYIYVYILLHRYLKEHMIVYGIEIASLIT